MDGTLGSWSTMFMDTYGNWKMSISDSGYVRPFAGFYFSGTSTGRDMFKLVNGAANGHEFDVGSMNVGAFNIQDVTYGADVLHLQQSPTVITNNGPNPVINFSVGTANAGIVDYMISAVSGTDYQTGGGSFRYVSARYTSTVASVVDLADCQLTAVTTGTLTWTMDTTISGNNIMVRVTPVSSLSSPTIQFRSSIRNMSSGVGTITPQ